MGYGSMWDNTPKESAHGGEKPVDSIPDGDYTAIVEDFSVFQAKSGEWYASWYLRIATGVQEGKHVQRFLSLDRNIGRLKADLDLVIGRIPEWDGDLVDEEKGRTGPALQEAIGAKVAIRHKTTRKGPGVYVDVYINKLLAKPSAAASNAQHAAPGGDPAEDEIPEQRWSEERKQLPKHKASPPPPAKGTVDGWGHPDCKVCRGAGCEECVDL